MLLPALLLVSAPLAAAASSFESTVVPFVRKNCAMCHNARKQEGGVNLLEFQTEASVGARRDVWETVTRKIKTGEMPPPPLPKPPASQSALVLGWVEKQSISNLLDARYTFLNETLARHYGISGVTGEEFRKVQLPDGRRGGILSMASVLTVSSYATRTSPVLRGKWVLENVLNAPPPPPPPDVQLLDEKTVGTKMSMREQLKLHRTNPTCASCHNRMDTLGFGLENYDAIGAWRDKDGAFLLDTSGKLPTGETFSGPEQLKKILASDMRPFAECFTEKILTFALGRGLERTDRRAVQAIVNNAATRQYRMQAFILEIVKSTPFQKRRPEAPKS
jgi:hypothetical protein